jgi:hypothetical protein
MVNLNKSVGTEGINRRSAADFTGTKTLLANVISS